MNGRERSRRWRAAWTWPAVLTAGSVCALVIALIADGSLGWNLFCWALLLAPVGVVVRALLG